MKKCKRLISGVLSIVLTLQLTMLSASAAFHSSTLYEFDDGDLHMVVEYAQEQTFIYEKLTISEHTAEGDVAYVVEKKVFPNSMIVVYTNGRLTQTRFSGDYDSFVAAAQGQKAFIPCTQPFSAAVTHGCGYSQSHTYLSSHSETVDIAVDDLKTSAVITLVAGLLDGAAGAALGLIASIARYAASVKADYIDLTETKYFVHGAYANDMHCFHTYVEYYNITSKGEKDILGTDWKYYQALI